jgi:hypothetical protein
MGFNIRLPTPRPVLLTLSGFARLYDAVLHLQLRQLAS